MAPNIVTQTKSLRKSSSRSSFALLTSILAAWLATVAGCTSSLPVASLSVLAVQNTQKSVTKKELKITTLEQEA